MGVAFQREPVYALWTELDPLADEHWREVAWEPASHAKLDHERYERAESSGCYHMLTARDEATGRLIGYAGFWISNNPQQSTSLEASQDCVFLDPEFRIGSTGTDFLRFCDRYLEDLGIRVIYHHVRKARDWSPVLRAMGYREIEKTYARITRN